MEFPMAGLKRCLGIDFEGQSVKLVEMALEKGEVRVVRAMSAPVPVGSEALDSERSNAIVGVVRDMIKQNKISTKKAVFCMPGQTVFVRRQRLPRAALSKLTQAIRMEARRAIPFPLEKTILRYQMFEEENTNEIEVLMVAMKKETYDEFIRMVRRMGLKIAGVSVSSLALYNAQELRNFDIGKWLEDSGAVKKKKKKKGEAEEEEDDELADLGGGFEEVRAYVNLGAKATDLAVCKDGTSGIVGFTRSIPTGANSIVKALMNEFGCESFEEAEEIKANKSAVKSGQFEIEADPEAYDPQACEVVTRLADRLIAEIRRSLDYYISQPDGMAVDVIMLSGEALEVPYFPGYIEERLGIPVEVTNTIPNPKVAVDEELEGDFDAAPYMIATGLASQGLGMCPVNIDFISGPGAAHASSAGGVPKGFGLEVAAIVAIIAGMVYYGTQVGEARIRNLEEMTRQLQSDISRREPQKELYNTAIQKFNSAKGQVDKLQQAYVSGDFWLRFLGDLQKNKPAEILITNVSCKPASLNVFGDVLLRGEAEEDTSVTKFIKILGNDALTPYIHKASIKTFRRRPSKNFEGNTWAFEIAIRVADTEGRVIKNQTMGSYTRGLSDVNRDEEDEDRD
jgi:type IV pilus assembly protein PilM